MRTLILLTITALIPTLVFSTDRTLISGEVLDKEFKKEIEGLEEYLWNRQVHSHEQGLEDLCNAMFGETKKTDVKLSNDITPGLLPKDSKIIWSASFADDQSLSLHAQAIDDKSYYIWVSRVVRLMEKVSVFVSSKELLKLENIYPLAAYQENLGTEYSFYMGSKTDSNFMKLNIQIEAENVKIAIATVPQLKQFTSTTVTVLIRSEGKDYLYARSRDQLVKYDLSTGNNEGLIYGGGIDVEEISSSWSGVPYIVGVQKVPNGKSFFVSSTIDSERKKDSRVYSEIKLVSTGTFGIVISAKSDSVGVSTSIIYPINAKDFDSLSHSEYVISSELNSVVLTNFYAIFGIGNNLYWRLRTPESKDDKAIWQTVIPQALEGANFRHFSGVIGLNKPSTKMPAINWYIAEEGGYSPRISSFGTGPVTITCSKPSKEISDKKEHLIDITYDLAGTAGYEIKVKFLGPNTLPIIPTGPVAIWKILVLVGLISCCCCLSLVFWFKIGKEEEIDETSESNITMNTNAPLFSD